MELHRCLQALRTNHVDNQPLQPTMSAEFEGVLHAALTPVALISGVGLLLLSMIDHYHYALNRLRQFMAERARTTAPLDRERLSRSIQIIYRRCRVMKIAIFSLLTSILASSLIVLLTVIEELWALHVEPAKSLLLFVAVVLVGIAVVLFVFGVRYSLQALQLELEEAS